MGKGIQGVRPYSNYDTHAAGDGTGQLCAAGAEATTFGDGTKGIAVSFITVLYADKACYLATTKALSEAAASGTNTSRIYIPEGASGITLPWAHEDVFFVPATNGETPFLALAGLV